MDPKPQALSSIVGHTLTRSDVAARLGVSTSSVRRMEFDQLHPVRDERGVWRFDAAEVDAVAPRTRSPCRRLPSRTKRAKEGRLAAHVFRLFAKRWTLPQIVLATKEPPARIRALYHEWSTSLEAAEWRLRDL